jgi:hypothetical protein
MHAPFRPRRLAHAAAVDDCGYGAGLGEERRLGLNFRQRLAKTEEETGCIDERCVLGVLAHP